MSSLLEQYLSEVAAYLGPLPASRRNDELREIRQHLQNAVIVNQKVMGQTEEEAATNAILQFGSPAEFSENLISSWRRERKRDWRNILGVMFATPIVLALTLLLCVPLFVVLANQIGSSFFGGFRHTQALDWTYADACYLLPNALTGIILAAMMPKQAVRGMCLGMLLFDGIRFAFTGGYPYGMNINLFPCSLSDLMITLVGIGSAWVVSRRRLRTALVAQK